MKEYKLDRIALTGRLAAESESRLNELAARGWEMKFVLQAPGANDFYAVFERESLPVVAEESEPSVPPKKRGRPPKNQSVE